MRFLLDTHAFVWLDSVPRKLSTEVSVICNDLSNELFVSIATVWEMQIKLQLGKLDLPESLEETINRQTKTNQVEILPLDVKHILRLTSLPDYHKDPFDRILVAQALVDDLIILSVDNQIAKYPVQVIW